MNDSQRSNVYEIQAILWFILGFLMTHFGDTAFTKVLGSLAIIVGIIGTIGSILFAIRSRKDV